MKGYERNHRAHREKNISVFSKKHKEKGKKIMIAQINLNKLIHCEEIRKRILGNTFPKRIIIRAFRIEKLGEKQENRKHI